MKTFTVAFIVPRHIGQLVSCIAHSKQQTKWEHGRKTMHTSFSMQTLHILLDFRASFSTFSDERAVKRNIHIMQPLNTLNTFDFAAIKFYIFKYFKFPCYLNCIFLTVPKTS